MRESSVQSRSFPWFAAAIIAAVFASPLHAATVTWDFNLPADAGYTPPYPSVGTLTLTDGFDSSAGEKYVEFVFDPNESNPGFDPTKSQIFALNIAYRGEDLLSTALVDKNPTVAPIKSFSAEVAPPASAWNLDAGYTTNPKENGTGEILVTWETASGSEFLVGETSTWWIYGLDIATNFSDVMGVPTATGKPGPTFGIVSTSKIDSGAGKAPSSNWVTGPNPVPIPGAVWLFASALGVFGYIGKKRASA